MNAPVPPRFSLSHAFVVRLLAVVIAVVPAVLVMASPLPLWLRAWLWAPVAGLPLALAFGRVRGRSAVNVLASIWAFVRRRRKYVWRVRQTEHEIEEVSLKAPGTDWRRRFVGNAGTLGLAIGVALTVGALGLAGAAAGSVRWAARRTTQESATTMAKSPSPEISPTAVSAATRTESHALPPTSPLGKPMLAGVATPSAATVISTSALLRAGAETREETREWRLMAFPGALSIRNTTSDSCRVAFYAPGGRWSAAIRMPGTETAKLLVTPLLQPEMAGRAVVVRSSCTLDIQSIPFRPQQPEYSQLWLIPIRDSPGRVRVKLHESSASGGMTLLDMKGDPVTAVAVPPTGAWAPRPPERGCWLYRIETTEPVWLEVFVIKEFKE